MNISEGDVVEYKDEDGDDELMFDQGWSISEDCGSKDEDGDDGNNHYLLVDEELNIDKDGEMKELNFQEFEPMSIMAITPQLFIGSFILFFLFYFIVSIRFYFVRSLLNSSNSPKIFYFIFIIIIIIL